MLASLIAFAAEVAGEEESSQTLFYVAGGVLAAWAVVLSALGISRHEGWPSEGAGRAVMGISAVLVAFTMASAIISS